MSRSDEIPVSIAARRLKISRSWVYRLIHEGKLRAKRYSTRKTFVSVPSIILYLADLNQDKP